MNFFHSRKRGCPSGDALRLSCSVSGLPLSLYLMASLIPLSLLWASYSSLGVRGCTFDSPCKFIMCPISLSWLESDNNQIASPFCWASNASTVALIQSSSTSSVHMSIYSSIWLYPRQCISILVGCTVSISHSEIEVSQLCYPPITCCVPFHCS